MKKILLASMFLSVFCCGTNSFAGSNDDITNACYATTKCGVKDNIQVMTAIPFAVGGTVLGGAGGLALGTLVPWAAGPGVGFVIGAGAGAYGGYLVGDHLGGYLAKSYDANEYMYFEDGTCLECDTHQMGEHYECPNGTIASNGTYWYRCRTETFGDSWEEYKPLPCRNSPIQDTSVKGAMYEVKATVDKRVNTGVYVYSGDVCLYITCGDGVLDKNKNECVAKGGNDGGNDGGDDGKKPRACRESRDSAEGKACCDLPSSVATWNGSNCVCTGGKNFKIVNGKGQCVVPENKDGGSFECSSSDLALFAQWKVDCASETAIINLISQIEILCRSESKTAEQYNNLYTVLTAAVGVNCRETVVDTQSRAAIISAGGVLDSIVAGLETSKWKNEEGKFNTARLASDSIAGVVLGTAGGLITSSVVKKNQIENGFEDMRCTVGGQEVAEWDDEFSVGRK